MLLGESKKCAMEFLEIINCTSPLFNNFIALLTIIGFCITLYIAFQMKSIKKSYLKKAQLPILLKKLITEKKKLYNILSGDEKFEQKEKQVLLILSTVKSLLENAEKKLTNESKTKINVLIDSLKNGNFSSKLIKTVDNKTSWEILNELNEMNEHLEFLLSDSKYED